MPSGIRSENRKESLWLAALFASSLVALVQACYLALGALNDELLAPFAAPLVCQLGLSAVISSVRLTSERGSAGLAILILTIVVIGQLKMKLSLLEDERYRLAAAREEEENAKIENEQKALAEKIERELWVQREQARRRQIAQDWQIEQDWQKQKEQRQITVQLEVEMSNQPILLTQEASVPIHRSIAVHRRDRDTREMLNRINDADQLYGLFQVDGTVMVDNVQLPTNVILERASGANSLGGQ